MSLLRRLFSDAAAASVGGLRLRIPVDHHSALPAELSFLALVNTAALSLALRACVWVIV